MNKKRQYILSGLAMILIPLSMSAQVVSKYSLDALKQQKQSIQASNKLNEYCLFHIVKEGRP